MTGFNSKRDAGAIKLKSAWVFPEKKTFLHRSDCAVHNGPAYPAGKCDCGATQPVQEPVEEWPGQSNIESQHNACQHRGYCKQLKAQPPLPAQPVQEPVAWGFRSADGAIYDCISPKAHDECEGSYNVPLFTTPPQRPWVGLTDEDGCAMPQAWWDGALWAEAKLKEKNA